MNAFDTRLLITETFISLCGEMPLEKISISDIVERTGKNRKTFYYHFENKDYLVMWIFRHDLGEILERSFPRNVLVYEPNNENSLAEFPYYITLKSGVRSLDHSRFFECFEKTLKTRGSFYTQALFSNDPCSLCTYLYSLYLPALKNDINLILSNRYLPQENVQFLAEFYTGAFLSYFTKKYSNQRRISQPASSSGPFANIIHSSLEMEIKEAQLRRNL